MNEQRKKYDVSCPHCCGTFLETTPAFDPDRPANGSMFAAKQHIKDAGWSVFPLYDTTEYANLVCPSCDGALVDSLGRVLRLVDTGELHPTAVQPHWDLRDLMGPAFESGRKDWPGTQYAETVMEPVEKPVGGGDPIPAPDDVTFPAGPITITNDTTGKVQCPVCGKSYHPSAMKRHMTMQHPASA